MKSSPLRVALVAPYFGRDLRGRKERFSFAYATHLALEGLDLEVLTTTTTPDAPDENFYRAGRDNTEPFAVHRCRVLAPDRVAYAQAVIDAARQDPAFLVPSRVLLDEQLNSPDLLAHIRATGDRYDAFLFVDVSAPTTVRAIADVAERSLLVPLLDDEPVVHVPDVAEAALRARTILCTTEAELGLVAQLFGPEARARSRLIGIAPDTVPPGELQSLSPRVARGRPYVLVVGNAAPPAGTFEETHAVVRLETSDERDRALLFANADAVVVAGEGLAFAPEVIEAWAYGKAVLCAAHARGVATLVRETGGGIVVAEGGWAPAAAGLRDGAGLAALGRLGGAFVEAGGGWPEVARRTFAAITVMTQPDDGRSRDALLAHVAYLYPLVQRQRRTIEAMRSSRFWQLRERWFALRGRFGIGPPDDPVPLGAGEDRAVGLASLGDPYQLYRLQHQLRAEDADRIRAMTRFLPHTFSFCVLVDARGGRDGLTATLRSLQDQLYVRWSARILTPAAEEGQPETPIEDWLSGDERVTVVPPGGDWFGADDFIIPLEPGDRLEPHALFECALAAQENVDVVYSDEDRLDGQGVASSPWFKPDWSPETFLTRDYVGCLCAFRRVALERVGGVRDVFESARWFEALLRLTEHTERVAHIAEILCHRGPDHVVERSDLALAVEVALKRRGEAASVRPVAGGLDVHFLVPGDERVSVIVSGSTRADLLRTCIAAVFERTSYAPFELIVAGEARDAAATQLFDEWRAREPNRFRVLADGATGLRAANAAVRAAEAPYVVLLAGNTEVIAPEWIEALLGQARRAPIGAAGAMLLYADGSVRHAGIVLGILGSSGNAHRTLPADALGYHGALQLDTNYLAVSGDALMVAQRKYEEVGGFDEEAADSVADIDFCLKLHAAGYRNVFVPRARLYQHAAKGVADRDGAAVRRAAGAGILRARWPALTRRDPYYSPHLTVDAEDFALRL